MTGQPSNIAEIARAFLRLGLMSFGGPIAHLGYFHSEFVDKRKWISESDYADLVALCQFLPGPASSQVVFAIGMKRAGLPGAITASLCFTLPSAILMILFAYGIASISDLSRAGWLHGLKLAAVAVVGQAIWGMGKNLCPDRSRVTLCLLTAAAILFFPSSITQIILIAIGGFLGIALFRSKAKTELSADSLQEKQSHRYAVAALFIFALLLIALPLLSQATHARAIEQFDSFYRSGSLVFGGGHVVLPLLRQEIVPRGWLTDDRFLAGYGAAQAMPGPLFTFCAFLGVAMQPGRLAWLNGLWCLLAIFLPAWLLIGGALPFWDKLKSKRWARAGLIGANASVVGVLLAAFYSPICTEGIRSSKDAAIAIIGFLFLQHWKWPSWLIVLGMLLTGICFT